MSQLFVLLYEPLAVGLLERLEQAPIFGVLLFLLGVFMLWLAKELDRRNYVVARTTPLPISLVREGDDVWVEGKPHVDQPLIAPVFGVECLYYRYEGHERKKMALSNIEKKACVFSLEADGASLWVDGQEAEFAMCETLEKMDSSKEHKLTYVPYPIEKLSVSGYALKQGDKLWLKPQGNVPLVVTPLGRKEYFRNSEIVETLCRIFGFVFLFLGTVGLLAGLDSYVLQIFLSEEERYRAALIGASLVTFVTWTAHVYNRIVALRTRVENAWRHVDIDLKLRYDLIPNLIVTVKEYLKHERELLERLGRLRSRLAKSTRDEQVRGDREFSANLRTFLAVCENYPELKADKTVMELLNQLQIVEEKLSHCRSVYNDAVTEYNSYISSFPQVLVGKLLGATPASLFFQREDEEREA